MTRKELNIGPKKGGEEVINKAIKFCDAKGSFSKREKHLNLSFSS